METRIFTWAKRTSGNQVWKPGTHLGLRDTSADFSVVAWGLTGFPNFYSFIMMILYHLIKKKKKKYFFINLSGLWNWFVKISLGILSNIFLMSTEQSLITRQTLKGSCFPKCIFRLVINMAKNLYRVYHTSTTDAPLTIQLNTLLFTPVSTSVFNSLLQCLLIIILITIVINSRIFCIGWLWSFDAYSILHRMFPKIMTSNMCSWGFHQSFQPLVTIVHCKTTG